MLLTTLIKLEDSMPSKTSGVRYAMETESKACWTLWQSV